MKKGKNLKLTGYKNYKVTFGTVDSKNLKSIYINIQSWAQPKEHIDSPSRSVNTLCRQIKHTVYETLNKDIFNEKFIVDLDLRSSGIQLGKKSFMNLECFLYVNEETDFKSFRLKSEIKKIADKIIKVNFTNSKTYDFSLTKKDIKVSHLTN
jgi:hypothetical protein